jgi:hypothetical protein
MSEKRYVLPEGMRGAALMSLDDPAHTPNIVAYWEFLEAALRWQSENPQVPTEQQLSDMAADAHVCMDEVIAEWQRRMYLAPEPEVDRVDFYVKGSDGEYRPWKPTEEQVRLGGEFFRSPIRCLDCGTYFIGDSCPCKKKSNPEVAQQSFDTAFGRFEIDDRVPPGEIRLHDWNGPVLIRNLRTPEHFAKHERGHNTEPEPEVPEELKDLLLSGSRTTMGSGRLESLLVEAFRRSQKARTA